MRVALNLEQLLHRPPGGIGRYSAELARLLPVDGADGRRPGRGRCRSSRDTRRVTVEAALVRVRRSSGSSRCGSRCPGRRCTTSWNDLGCRRPAPPARAALRDFDLVHAPSLAVPPRERCRARRDRPRRRADPLSRHVHAPGPVVPPARVRGRGEARRPRHRADERRGRRGRRLHADPADRIRVGPARRRRSARWARALVESTRAMLDVGAAPYVLWVGTLEPRKNVAVARRGASGAWSSASDLPHRLVIVGPKGWLGTADALRGAGTGPGQPHPLHRTGARGPVARALPRRRPRRAPEPARGLRPAGDRGDVAVDRRALLRHPGAARGRGRRRPVRPADGPRRVGAPSSPRCSATTRPGPRSAAAGRARAVELHLGRLRPHDPRPLPRGPRQLTSSALCGKWVSDTQKPHKAEGWATSRGRPTPGGGAVRCRRWCRGRGRGRRAGRRAA